MKTIPRLALSAGLALGVAGGCDYEFSHRGNADVEYNQQVRDCAQQLGTVATHARSFPAACENLGENYFNSKYYDIDSYNAATGNDNDNNYTIYALPTQANFLEANLDSSDTIKKDADNLHHFVLVMSAFVGVLVMSGVYDSTGRHNRRKQLKAQKMQPATT